MDNIDNNQKYIAETAIDILHRLETRISLMEANLGLAPINQEISAESTGFQAFKAAGSEDTNFEFRIGEFWLARVGTVILLMGIAFFISYPFPSIPPLIASLFGYMAVAGLFGISQYWRKTSPYLSQLLFGGSLILLYFATLRLHFFSSNPIIPSKIIGLALLLLILIFDLIVAAKQRKETLTAIILFLCYATSLFSNTAHFTLILITLTSATALFFLVKYNWHNVAILSLVMVFTTHLLWLINNPIIGNPIQPISQHHYNLAYLVLYGSFYALINILRDTESYSEFFEIVLTIFTGIGIFSIGAFNVFSYFKPLLSLLCFLTSLLFLSFAILNWKHTRSGYSTAYYSCFAYIALSVSIFSQFQYPDYFIWLGLQSLLVIITALWFRSRVIIIVNILIYLGIFIAYLGYAPPNSFVNLSYAITALVSARILNWKKERLELKTDLIRNTYLTCVFVIVLYGLYHAIPSNYVSFSWLGAALFYFGLSLLLNNIKYRYMTILTIFATVIHVFLIDMARLHAGFRIILFLVVGAVILLLSLFYSKYRKKIFAPGTMSSR